ncbi:MAG: phosphoribosylformylglycinamidine synthase [Christensenellales bacterium]|jgi:phosphoribosylformylglycinamidine synthase
MVHRLFVEKKKGFDVEAGHLKNDLLGNLGVRGLENLRILKRYDISGLTDVELEKTVSTVFSEPNVDEVCFEEMPKVKGHVFACAYLPGQYDQRADSAAQCVQMITLGERPIIRCANVYVLEGGISNEDVERIKVYLINPIESCEVSLEKPETLDENMPVPDDVPIIEGFTAMDDGQIAGMIAERGMAMTAADLICVRDHFKAEGRDPSETEIRVIDTYWSDHCRHTTFLTELTDVTFGDEAGFIKAAFDEYLAARKAVGRDNRPVSLMDIATISPKIMKAEGLADDLDESEEINACSIKVTANVDGKNEEWLVMFKNETHNHPTEIEPFGGAATCLGGAIRDPLSGRSYVYQAMRITGAADIRAPHDETLPGKLSQRKISTGAAAGYSSYGNQIGLATGMVKEIYHPGYVAKRMELGAVIGAAPKANVVRERPSPGDVILLVGGRTGRDGCGGATGSSKAHDISSLESCGAEVQKGNPPTERALQRLFRRKEASTLIKRCNDFGAGGVCVAIGELAPGLDIDLDRVPKKYGGLDGTELAISESQERMAVVIAEKDAETFIELAAQENLEATKVAVVSSVPRLRMSWRGRTIVDLKRDFLDTNGAAQQSKAHAAAVDAGGFFAEREISFAENLALLNNCSQRGLVERFDSTVGAATVLLPYGGKYAGTESQAMCAKLPVDGETVTCTLMAHGFNPELSKLSPFHGACYAVLESVAKIAASGGDASKARLTLQEFFERLGDDATRWGKPLSALLGAFHAQMRMKLPAIGGKDSMSGSFGDLDVPPTLVSFAVTAQDTKDIISPELKSPGNKICALKVERDENGLPNLEKAMAGFAKLKDQIAKGNAKSAYVVGEGGYAAALCKMAFGNRIGADFVAEENLFAPLIGDILVECEKAPEGWPVIAVTTESDYISAQGEKWPLAELVCAWEKPISEIFAYKTDVEREMYPSPLFTKRNISKPAIKSLRPRVFIPVYPGTNCEYDSARAFERAGAQSDVFVIRNRSAHETQQSLEEMARRIEKCQIMMLPGGFSLGDEPDGSGKFIAATLRNPAVADAVMALLRKRDGLMLGICNGFQALIKTGLVPYGEIRQTKTDSPTLAFNAIGRHMATVIRTKIVSVKSPWMSLVGAGDVHALPISHGEGRFICTEQQVKALFENGQVASQYVDMDGNAVSHMPYNPNGSMYAIEGITSPDGRVLGKMAHSERIGERVGINICGERDQKIFESGVLYFK